MTDDLNLSLWAARRAEQGTLQAHSDYVVKEIADLEAEIKKLRKGLEIYERERNRFKHAKPEMTGAYFLSGGHGPKDDNMMPQFVEIVPAYGCGWSMVYEDTGRTISYEGS